MSFTAGGYFCRRYEKCKDNSGASDVIVLLRMRARRHFGP